MSDAYRIMYIGHDGSYWESLCERLQAQFSSFSYEFHNIARENESEIQEIIIDIINYAPNLIYVDFSKHSEDYLHLARVIKRLNSTKKIPVVGLHENNTADTLSMYAVNANVFNNHIKSGEIHDVAYDAVNILNPGSNEELKFAMAQTNEPFFAYDIVKIGYVTENYFFIETNRNLKEGEKILLNNYFTKNKVLNSSYFEVAEKGETDCYYNKKFWYKIKPLFIDPVKSDSEASADLMAERKRSREEEIPAVKQKLSKWVKENLDKSNPKTVKMLFIDKLLNIYHNQPRSDRYNFVIRCQPYLREVEPEIKSLNPDIIVFQYDGKNVSALIKQQHSPKEKTEEQKKAAQEALEKGEKPRNVPNIVSDYSNNDETLKAILDLFRDKESKTPFVFVYNSPTADSKELQENFGYKNIIAQPGFVQPELLMKMAEKLGTKLEQQGTSQNENKIVFKKNNPQSFAEIAFQVNIVNICESEVHFTSTMPITTNQCIRMMEPTSMYLTVVTHNESSLATVGREGFRGLVNCTGEDDKMNIRKYINAIFFRDKEAAKNAEKEEFEKVKQAAIKRKEESARKEQEMAEKKAKQAVEEADRKDDSDSIAAQQSKQAIETKSADAAKKNDKKD